MQNRHRPPGAKEEPCPEHSGVAQPLRPKSVTIPQTRNPNPEVWKTKPRFRNPEPSAPQGARKSLPPSIQVLPNPCARTPLRYPKTDTQTPKFENRNPDPEIRNHSPPRGKRRAFLQAFRSPSPYTRNPTFETRNPKPENRDLKS